jgi:hypothetical protein
VGAGIHILLKVDCHRIFKKKKKKLSIDCRQAIEDTSIRYFNRNMLEDCKWSFLSNSCPSNEANDKKKMAIQGHKSPST